MFFKTIFMFFMFLFRMYLVHSVYLYCFVYCFSFLYSFLFPISVQVYRPLPKGGNPLAVNKYHTIIEYNFLCKVPLFALS
jgi:hypothetical protein